MAMRARWRPPSSCAWSIASASSGAPRKVAAPVDETFFSSNQKGAPVGRLIMILVDQGNIRTGSARPSMQSAKKFVDALEPEDRVAVVAVPAPGELVDFTDDHDKVREALLRITGTQHALRTRFNISITEAIAVYMRSDAQLAAEVVVRECGQAGSAADIERCEREVEQDAAEIVNDVRHRTQDSISGMRAVLKALGSIEGPKAVIVISEGLILEGPTSDVDDLASVAADSRASLDVLLLDVPAVRRVAGSPSHDSPSGPRSVGDRSRVAGGGLTRIACIASTRARNTRSTASPRRSMDTTCSASNRGPRIETAGATTSR